MLFWMPNSRRRASHDLPLGGERGGGYHCRPANNVILVPVQALHQLSANSYCRLRGGERKPALRIVTVGLQDAALPRSRPA